MRLSLTPGVARAACSVGQHTESVLRELGYDPPAIADLSQRGVIRLGASV